VSNHAENLHSCRLGSSWLHKEIVSVTRERLSRYRIFGPGTDPISLLILFLLGNTLQGSVVSSRIGMAELFFKLMCIDYWIYDMTSYFQDGGHDVPRRSLLHMR